MAACHDERWNKKEIHLKNFIGNDSGRMKENSNNKIKFHQKLLRNSRKENILLSVPQTLTVTFPK